MIKAIRCWLNRPVTHREYQDEGKWWYAMCVHCDRQREVHMTMRERFEQRYFGSQRHG